MSALSDVRVTGLLFAMLFNIMVTLLIFRLRVVGKDAPLTRSQRWGMTAAGFLYFVNSIQLGGMMLFHIGSDEVPGPILDGWNAIASTVNFVTLLPLLLFGLIYPRPALKWSKLKPIVIGLCALWVPLSILNFMLFLPGAIVFLGTKQPLVQDTYLLSMFIPLFLWLPWYRRQQSPQVSMIVTLLMWGYLMNPLIGLSDILYRQWAYDHPGVTGVLEPVASSAVLQQMLVIFVLIFMAKILIERFGRWSSSDKVNLALMLSSFGAIALLWVVYYGSAGIVDTQVYRNGAIGLVLFLITYGTWTVVRPLLFTYGLLRYQFFGHGVHATGTFAMVLGGLASSLLLAVSLFLLSGIGQIAAISISALAAAASLYPFYRLSLRLIGTLLPMSAGAKVPLAERRATYLMGLQTAVVNGAVEDRQDQEALQRLRKDLDVSQREHDILMDGFARERPQVEGKGMEAVYLFHRTGRMLGYVARKRSDQAAAGQMAALFTTVSNFLADTIKRGGGHVDSIEYGNVTLIAEVESEVALGVILSGKDNPQVRQRMRDVLRRIKKEYQDVLYAGQTTPEAMSRLKERTRGIESLLREFLSEGG